MAKRPGILRLHSKNELKLYSKSIAIHHNLSLKKQKKQETFASRIVAPWEIGWIAWLN